MIDTRNKLLTIYRAPNTLTFDDAIAEPKASNKFDEVLTAVQNA